MSAAPIDINAGEREPLSEARDPTIIDGITYPQANQKVYQTASMVTSIYSPLPSNNREFRHASQASNIPKSRVGKDSPRAQLWAFRYAKNAKNFHQRHAIEKQAILTSDGNEDKTSKIRNWVQSPSHQERSDEATPLSPRPLDPALDLVDVNPSSKLTVTRENIKRMIMQQVAETGKVEKNLKMVLDRERLGENRAQGLERRVGKLERDLSAFQNKYKNLEAMLMQEREEKQELVKQLRESRAKPAAADDGKAASRPADSKKPTVDAAKKPATAKKAAAVKKPTAARADDRKSAVKKVAEKKNGAKKKEVAVGGRTSARIAAAKK